MSAHGRNLPDFDAPPVIETVVGFSFSPLANWDLRYFGLLWQEISQDFPEFQVQPPIAEELEASSRVGLANLIVRAVGVTEPPVRCWFIDSSKTRLIQLQRDRFLHNWRQVAGGEEYPRYDSAIRPRFVREWERFRNFLDTYGIEAPKLRGWEVTYVNHMEQDREWSSLADLPKVFTWLNNVGISGATQLEQFALTTNFAIDESIRLSVSIRPATRHRDGRTVLVMNLTARGEAESEAEALAGIDRGREIIVNTFTTLTRPEMHLLWKKRA